MRGQKGSKTGKNHAKTTLFRKYSTKRRGKKGQKLRKSRKNTHIAGNIAQNTHTRVKYSNNNHHRQKYGLKRGKNHEKHALLRTFAEIWRKNTHNSALLAIFWPNSEYFMIINQILPPPMMPFTYEGQHPRGSSSSSPSLLGLDDFATIFFTINIFITSTSDLILYHFNLCLLVN